MSGEPRPRTPLEEKLQHYLWDGIASDVFRADRAKALARTIGQQADTLNAAGYGEPFGYFQEVLSEHQTLAIAKLYERPSKRFPVRSIPGALAMLEAHADEWTLHQPPSSIVSSACLPIEVPSSRRSLSES